MQTTITRTAHRHDQVEFQPWMLLDLDEPDPDADLELGFYTVLWLGSLMLAGGAAFDPFPDSVRDVAERFFAVIELDAKA